MSTVVEPKEKRKANAVQPFAVEILGNCSDICIQSIPGCKLRGAIKATKKVFNPVGPGPAVVTAPSGIIPGVPDLPGMELHISPGSCRYKIKDPLHGDEELCAMIKALVERQMGARTKGKLNGVPLQEGSLEPSRMRTLVREVLWLVDNGDAHLIKGTMPTIEDILKLPGKFLLNPSNQIPTMQPRYEEDFQAWVDKLATSGG